ncbi:peptidase inhibitor family I36 protein [Kitasatospora sp. NPDC002551]|uniref:peptidase inhibitor family I36 protein n=1 Tax=unclassified Kitasatospora TaxID=2633591 RepID=UPI00331DC04E
MRRALLSALSTAVMAAALAVGPVPGAHAAGTADCPRGWLCVWDQTDYQGHMFKFKDANATWPAAIENHDASWFNNGTSGLTACIWQGGAYTGTVKAVKAGASSPRDSAHAHRGSSNDWRSTCE